MNPDEMDYEPMKRVTQCVSHRQVRSIVKAYNGEGFESLVHTQDVLAKKKVARENKKQEMASGDEYRALSPSPTVGVGRSPRMAPPPPVAVAAGPTIGVGTASTGAPRTNVTMGMGTTPLVKQPGRGDRSLNQAQMQQKLEEILRQQQQTVAGRRIAGITTTYKNGQRSTVTRNSTSVRN